jgi:hypothetical protein
MELKLASRPLACSVVLGTVAILGCDSQSQPGQDALKANRETFKAVNEDLTQSVKANPKSKGALPKSVKGGLGGRTTPDNP